MNNNYCSHQSSNSMRFKNEFFKINRNMSALRLVPSSFSINSGNAKKKKKLKRHSQAVRSLKVINHTYASFAVYTRTNSV